MTGFFGDYDISSAADDPFSLEVGTYEGTITDFDGDISGQKKDGSGEYRGMQFTFTVTAPEKFEGAKYDQFFPLPVPQDSQRTAGIKRSMIKRFLAGVGVPADKMNGVDPNELVGLDIAFTIKETKSASNRTFKNAEVRLRGVGSRPNAGSTAGMDVFAPPVEDAEFGI